MYKKSIRHSLFKIIDTQLGNLLNILNAENHSKKNQKEPKKRTKKNHLRTSRLYHLIDGYFDFDLDFDNFIFFFPDLQIENKALPPRFSIYTKV
jgi:hypothetical protein